MVLGDEYLESLQGIDGVIESTSFGLLKPDPVHRRPGQEIRKEEQPDSVQRTHLLTQSPGIHREHRRNTDQEPAGHAMHGVVEVVRPRPPISP